MNKARVWIPFMVGALVLGAFSGCLDIVSTSRVNRDGTILRTITLKGDSAELARGNFPISLDSTWERSITPKDDHNQSILTVSRLFRDAQQMNEALHGTFGRTLQFQIEFEKSFQWFFTSFRYHETVLKFGQFDTIPISVYLSSAEIDAWRRFDMEKKPFETKGDSLALMSSVPRVEEWERRNLFEYVYAAFLDGVHDIHSLSLTDSLIAPMKDSLFRASARSDINIDTLRFLYARILKNPAVHKAWRASKARFDAIRGKAEFVHDVNSNSYETRVEMPGLVTNTNAPTIEGNRATWKNYKDVAKIFGYTMWVDSREVNWWAVIATGIVAIVLAAGLVLSSILKNR
jgi:hypothetical protein